MSETCKMHGYPIPVYEGKGSLTGGEFCRCGMWVAHPTMYRNVWGQRGQYEKLPHDQETCEEIACKSWRKFRDVYAQSHPGVTFNDETMEFERANSTES